MIVNHFFVDGAGHICLAWGVCQPKEVAALIGNKQPRPWVTLCIYNLLKPPSLVCQVHMSWVYRRHGVGASLHDWPPVDLRVHRLPWAELLCGQQQPSLHWHGERLSFTESWNLTNSQFSGQDAFPPHARHGHGAVLLPSGHLQHLLPSLWRHQAPHVNKVCQLFIFKIDKSM